MPSPPVVGKGRGVPAADGALTDADNRALGSILALGHGDGDYLCTREPDGTARLIVAGAG